MTTRDLIRCLEGTSKEPTSTYLVRGSIDYIVYIDYGGSLAAPDPKRAP